MIGYSRILKNRMSPYLDKRRKQNYNTANQSNEESIKHTSEKRDGKRIVKNMQGIFPSLN